MTDQKIRWIAANANQGSQLSKVKDMARDFCDAAISCVPIKQSERDPKQDAELAAKVFELSQGLEQKWITSAHAEKRQLPDLVCLNFRLDDVTLVPEIKSG